MPIEFPCPGTLLAYVLNYVVAWLFLLLAKLFVVDRNLDVMQGISASIQYMRGILTATVYLLVTGQPLARYALQSRPPMA